MVLPFSDVPPKTSGWQIQPKPWSGRSLWIVVLGMREILKMSVIGCSTNLWRWSKTVTAKRTVIEKTYRSLIVLLLLNKFSYFLKYSLEICYGVSVIVFSYVPKPCLSLRYLSYVYVSLWMVSCPFRIDWLVKSINQCQNHAGLYKLIFVWWAISYGSYIKHQRVEASWGALLINFRCHPAASANEKTFGVWGTTQICYKLACR